MHAARGAGGEARVAAGVRRAGGGAIILNADATAVARLQRPYSLDTLLADVAGSTDELVYVALTAGAVRLVHGVDAAALPEADASPALRRRRARARGDRRRGAGAGPVRTAAGRGSRGRDAPAGPAARRRAARRAADAGAPVRLALDGAGAHAGGHRVPRPQARVRRAQRAAPGGPGSPAPARPADRDGRAGVHGGPRGAQPAQRDRDGGAAPGARVHAARRRRRGSTPSSGSWWASSRARPSASTPSCSSSSSSRARRRWCGARWIWPRSSARPSRPSGRWRCRAA